MRVAALDLRPTSREGLLALVDERARFVRDYLTWAREHDRDDWSYRMDDRADIRAAAEAAELFPEAWWGVVVFTCFGAVLGARTVAPLFQQPLPAPEAEAVLADLTLPPRSIGHHRVQPAHKGAKQALIAACADHDLFYEVLHSGESFDVRYRRLRAARLRQWGRTTSFDLLLRAGALRIGDQHYRPEYAYLGGSTGPSRGFARVWGVEPADDSSVAWAEQILRLWADEWQAIAKRVGVIWTKPPLEPRDQENFLCIYQEHPQATGC